MIANHSIVFFGVIIVIIVLIGTISFHLVEGRGFFDAFYFTTVTMATVGYGDMAPVTHGGKIISIIYGFMGAPLFIGLTSILLQSNFQKIVKGSIHEYHKEIKEAEKLAHQIQEIQKENADELQDITIQKKSPRWKKFFSKH